MAREISKFDVRAVKLFCDNVIENAIGLNPNSIVKIMLDEQMDSLRIVHSREGDMARDRSVFDAYELKLFCDDIVEKAIGLEPNVIVEILAIMADENELMGEGE